MLYIIFDSRCTLQIYRPCLAKSTHKIEFIKQTNLNIIVKRKYTKNMKFGYRKLLILIDSCADQSEDCSRPHASRGYIKTVDQHLINFSFYFTGTNPVTDFVVQCLKRKLYNFLNIFLLSNRPKHGLYILKTTNL